MTFAWQVLEYHPEPWDQWVTIGNVLAARRDHAVLSIGPQQLPCLSGDTSNPISGKCPPLPPSTGQLCVPPAGRQDCHYDSVKAICCCGQCHTDYTCAPDSTTGSGLWQLMHLPFCPAVGCGTEGQLIDFEFNSLNFVN